jgi:hypothetical protein
MKHNQWKRNGTYLNRLYRNSSRGMWPKKLKEEKQGNTLVDRQNKGNCKEKK